MCWGWPSLRRQHRLLWYSLQCEYEVDCFASFNADLSHNLICKNYWYSILAGRDQPDTVRPDVASRSQRWHLEQGVWKLNIYSGSHIDRPDNKGATQHTASAASCVIIITVGNRRHTWAYETAMGHNVYWYEIQWYCPCHALVTVQSTMSFVFHILPVLWFEDP